MTDTETKLRAALERATNKMDEASHRLQNIHLILARELDDAVTRGLAVLRDTGDAAPQGPDRDVFGRTADEADADNWAEPPDMGAQ